MVAKDVRTVTARNLRLLETECGLSWIAPAGKIQEGLASREPVVPARDSWRIPYLGKLLAERDRLVYEGEEQSEEVEELQELIDSLCSS